MSWIESAQEAKFLFEITGTQYETLVLDFSVNERISNPFEMKISIACVDEINFDDVIGKESVLTIRGNEADRPLHGVINNFMQTGSRGRFYLYSATVVPSVWFLSLEKDCRIFQNKTVQDIVSQVFQEGGIASDRFEFRLQNQPQPKEYCVQYRETDLNFVSRLLEEEGIFYFFEHFEDKHIIVFADSTVAYQPIQGNANVTFNPSQGVVPEEECVYGFVFSKKVLSGKYTQRDFNFEKPSLDLTAQEQADTFQNYEVYDYPGSYLEEEKGKKLTQVRLQESIAYIETTEGNGVCPRFIPGFTFNLTDHDCSNFNQEYLLVEVLTTGAQPQALQEQAGEGMGMSYSNDFIAIPSSTIYKPNRNSRKPMIEGVQTAIVVGPQGEEIYTDEYGRVKVQFHWDREGTKDENSSCWIRVSQVSAGAGWGAIDIPRIGHEVIVSFLEGDPDRPIITGRVYNGTNMPPSDLPGGGMISGMKSNSTPGGGGYNEITMNDTKGEESMTIHAQYDMNTTVENDRSTTIVSGNDTTAVQAGTQSVTVKGDTSLTVEAGDRIVDVTGSYKLDTTSEVNIQAPDKITLTCGGSSITIEPGKITISAGDGSNLTLDANALMESSGGSQVFLDANALTESSGGSSVLLDANATMANSKGDQVLLDGKATVSSPAEATVNAPTANLVGGGGSVKADGSGISLVSGGMIKLNASMIQNNC